MPAALDCSAPTHPLEAASHPDPYPYYATLRAGTGLQRVRSPDLWVAASASAVQAALMLPEGRVRPPAEPIPAFLLGTAGETVYAKLARMNDGPAHVTLRARTLDLLWRIEGDLIAVAARGAARAAIQTLAGPVDAAGLDRLQRRLPALTVARALGLPAGLHEDVLSAVDGWVVGLSPAAKDAERRHGVACMDELLALLRHIGVEEVTDAAAHVALLMQPHDATAGLIGAGLLRLAQDEGCRRGAIDEELDWERFAEEVLRHDPPIQNTRRVLAAPAMLCGQAVEAGDMVLVVLAAASRDPSVHEHPDAFRLDRPRSSLVTLGAGPHACPGGPAAIAIATAAWRELLAQQEVAEHLPRLCARARWQASANARMPVFAAHGVTAP